MTDSAPTLAHLFELPSTDQSKPSPDGWQPFRERLAQEVKGVKWVASLPDLVSKITELLDIEIPGVFLKAWKKGSALNTKLAESRMAPEDVMYLELGSHTVTSTHRPYITVQVGKAPVKKLEFAVVASFTLKAFVLKIQGGEVREIRSGTCEAEGRLEGLGLVLAKKELAPMPLPGTLPVVEAPSRVI